MSEDNEQQKHGDESRDEAGDDQPDEKRESAYVLPWASVLGDFTRHYNQIISDAYSPVLRNIAAKFVPPNIASIFPYAQAANLVLPQVKLPAFNIDPVALGLGKTIADIVQNQQQAILSPLTAIIEQQHKQWDSVFQSIHKLTESIFPPNWKGVKRPRLAVIEAIAIDEGIPLAWIPSPDVLQAIFNAPDAVRRRQIIGRRWQRVTSDCEAVLGEVTNAKLQCHQPFATHIVRALREGHESAAQALAANLLDSILRRNFDKDDFKDVTTNKKGGVRFDLDTYQIRVAFTLGPIWRAYGEYWESRGDPIPRNFGRHPSAHAVSRTQYSRINAVIALMLVTSLLKLLDTELAP